MNRAKKAIITGISGQDGSYLAELLLSKGYKVCGIVRRNSVSQNQTVRLEAAGVYPHKSLTLEYGDMTDMASLVRILQEFEPDEIYNLAAQSHVKISFDQPIFTTDSIAMGTLNLLEAARMVCPEAKVYQAGSSEMFGNVIDSDGFQREGTPMLPVSPYGCAKVYAFNLARTYRESYKMFVANGILFNHESPRRGANFVTSKIVNGALDIYDKRSETLCLGNLNATRDWGHSKDYVEGMWRMLQQDTPDDFVLSTGRSHTVRDVCDYVFRRLGLNHDLHIQIDPKYFRPNELNDLKGDCSKAKRVLGWSHEYTFEKLLDEMVEYAAKVKGIKL